MDILFQWRCSILLENGEDALTNLEQTRKFPANTEGVHYSLVEAAFQMRELTIRDGRAFWAIGYEADRLRLVDAIHTIDTRYSCIG